MEGILRKDKEAVVVGEDGVFVRSPHIGIIAGIAVVVVEGKIKVRFGMGPGVTEEVSLDGDATKKLRQILKLAKEKVNS